MNIYTYIRGFPTTQVDVLPRLTGVCQVYLTQSVYEVVLQTSIPTQIR